jgi:protein-S-isoprenylcysteine O-methyltransferase Ste14
MDTICCHAELIERVIRLSAPVTTGIVLAAVGRNFLLARGIRPVAERRSSLVATASMLAFFGCVYGMIRLRLGIIHLTDADLRLAIEALGAALMVAGCAANVLGRIVLGRNWADQSTLYADQTLVTDSVFMIVRHPLYSSLIWMFYGSSLLFQNAAAAVATTILFVPAMYYRASLEERMLASRFSEYDRYRSRVGMLFPKLISVTPKRKR